MLVADAFMLAMISRPPSGTLRTTWVTPATIALCVAVVVVGIPLGVFAGAHAMATGALWFWAGSAATLLFATGSGAVVAVAIAQRAAKSVVGQA
jgi:hypothetical protein